MFLTLAQILSTEVISNKGNQESFQQEDLCPGYTVNLTCTFTVTPTVRWRVDNILVSTLVTSRESYSLSIESYIITSLINQTVSVFSYNLSVSNVESNIIVNNGSSVTCETDSEHRVNKQIVVIG